MVFYPFAAKKKVTVDFYTNIYFLRQNQILAYVLPERFKTESVCIAAVKNNRSAIVAVPKILKDFVIKEVDKSPSV